MNKPVFRFLADDPKLPIELRAVAGGGNGTQERLGLDFSFGYLALRVDGHYEDGVLDLQSRVGSLPFSAESPVARAALLAIVEAANRHLGGAFQLEGGQIRIIRRRPVPLPLSAAGLVAAIVTALVPLKPYVQAIGTYLVLPGDDDTRGAGKVRPTWRRGAPTGTKGSRRPSAA